MFGVDLIVMETFGSDTSPPDIASVRRVRQCDLFIGIYGHRYGTIDQTSGESITELELDEADRSFSSGSLKDVLLYAIEGDASWLSDHREQSEAAKAGISRLREKVSKHTYSRFSAADELLFLIIRDVYRRISNRLDRAPLKVRSAGLPPMRALQEPVGMEFLQSIYRAYLIGRARETEELLSTFEKQAFVLLLGDSGVGKTSLIHAGLLPEAMERGWRTVYTRPFGFPSTDIVRQIHATVFENTAIHSGTIVSMMAEVIAALEDQRILLVIDQFEDILAARDVGEIERLVSALSELRVLVNPSFRVLISYRADLEGRLGTYWQVISGSATGLPRVYIAGIAPDAAWQGVAEAAQGFSVELALRQTEQNRIKKDLLVASQALGISDVYPPYVQMFIHHVWGSARARNGVYSFRDYRKVGSIEGIVGGYLTRQMDYARDSKGHIRSILVSLVRSYGVKAQRSIEEIAADTGLTTEECEVALERLIDLRLTRHIESYYEVTHDFLAKKIVAEVADADERDFKRFRELLASKAIAYATTGNPLSAEEMLMLYKHRQRILPNELELRLLVASWVRGRGPALHWLLGAKPAKVIEWLRAEESKEGLERQAKVAIVLLRRKLEDRPLSENDYMAFREYQLSSELAWLIAEDPLSIPNDLLLYGHRHRRREVRVACREAIVAKVKGGDWDWIVRLRKSRSPYSFQAYAELVERGNVAIGQICPHPEKALREFEVLQNICRATTPFEARRHYATLRKMRGPERSLSFGKALSLIREGRMKILLKRVEMATVAQAATMLTAVGDKMVAADFCDLLRCYQDWEGRLRSHPTKQALGVKLELLSGAIARATSDGHVAALRKLMRAVSLKRPSRGLVLALFKYGTIADLMYLLNRIASEKDRVDYWNHLELGRAVTTRLSNRHERVPQALIAVAKRKEFGRYMPREERSKQARDALLPLANVDNRALYIRLVAYGIIGAAKSEEIQPLVQLCSHEYTSIARAAASQLAHLLDRQALRILAENIDIGVQQGAAASLAEALRSAEMAVFRVVGLG